MVQKQKGQQGEIRGNANAGCGMTEFSGKKLYLYVCKKSLKPDLNIRPEAQNIIFMFRIIAEETNVVNILLLRISHFPRNILDKCTLANIFRITTKFYIGDGGLVF